jgi:hypothetical protein
MSLGERDRGPGVDAGSRGAQSANALGVATTRARDREPQRDLSIIAHSPGMRIAAGRVGHRGGPVPAVAPEPDRRGAVGTGPRLVERESCWRWAALFCLPTRASAAPTPAESFAAVPTRYDAASAPQFCFPIGIRKCRSFAGAEARDVVGSAAHPVEAVVLKARPPS